MRRTTVVALVFFLCGLTLGVACNTGGAVAAQEQGIFKVGYIIASPGLTQTEIYEVQAITGRWLRVTVHSHSGWKTGSEVWLNPETGKTFVIEVPKK
jgi:hypothetical protein